MPLQSDLGSPLRERNADEILSTLEPVSLPGLQRLPLPDEWYGHVRGESPPVVGNPMSFGDWRRHDPLERRHSWGLDLEERARGYFDEHHRQHHGGDHYHHRHQDSDYVEDDEQQQQPAEDVDAAGPREHLAPVELQDHLPEQSLPHDTASAPPQGRRPSTGEGIAPDEGDYVDIPPSAPPAVADGTIVDGTTGEAPQTPKPKRNPLWISPRFKSQQKTPTLADDPNNPRLFRHRLTKFARRRPGYGRNDRRKSQGQIQNDMETVLRAQNVTNTLLAAGPAVNLLALLLLEDDYGILRSPLLLTLLGVTVTDITGDPRKANRRFRLSLEYGVGPDRIKWAVDRLAADLIRLHSILKIKQKWHGQKWNSSHHNIEQRTRLPTVPYPPQWRNRPREIEDGGDPDNTLIVTLHLGHLLRLAMHRLLTVISRGLAALASLRMIRRERQNNEYIIKVWEYLLEVIKLVSFRPESNKLFYFLEILPILCLLGYESGYMGKQGVAYIGGTAKSQGWRVGHFKPNDLYGIYDRRKDKWMLVRNSYVMYVLNINSTIPLDVFLVDPLFKIEYDGSIDEAEAARDNDGCVDIDEPEDQQRGHRLSPFTHKITLENNERKMVIHVKEKEMWLWVKLLNDMKNLTIYSEPNRFGLFAPIRQNCFAKWFVDGRDHFWAILLALEMAKDTIFIHDWWLLPELYLRRPANGNQQWRLDRVLQRKAQQGVKIFVVIYRNVGTTVATDSLWTKHSLMSMNEDNIHVLRLPNQFLLGTYFWAHHEKLCIVDSTVAFVGGIDLCYGRYDTADHVLTDDSKINFKLLDPDARNPEDFTQFQIFPGKDYSNPRVMDFVELDKPYEDMYDRNKVPRMPWHDVHMMTAGQVARDLGRHFVQRWNYLLRQKRPLRLTPLLTPPPPLLDDEVRRLGLLGTCEVQIVRLLGEWLLGLKKHEQLIQNAYLKLIETLEHFVYIENQFFITLCEVLGTIIKNRLGDALVERIIRAHREGRKWKAIIVIPLMPGFPAEIDETEGLLVRVIMQCQFYLILRGLLLIFAKLRKVGIDPDDYIQFFSLRKWGRIGPDRNLVTEQLYIHAKTMVVDDRAAIIGLANINERLMRGLRDSEVCAVVRDTDTIDSTMDGQPYKVGKFPHTLRLRLMREHLGVAVDILDLVERRFQKFEEFAATGEGMAAATGSYPDIKYTRMLAAVELALRDILQLPDGTPRWHNYQEHHRRHDPATMPDNLDEEMFGYDEMPTPIPLTVSFNNRTGSHEANKGIRDKKKHLYDLRVQNNPDKKKDVLGEGPDKYRLKLAKRARLFAGKLLREIAHRQMLENPTKQFLPDLGTVKDFLESDDADMVDPMDAELAHIIYERNVERWQLLKRILYLQRVAAKAKEDEDKEAKKRLAAGLPATVNIGGGGANNSKSALPEPAEVGVAEVDTVNGSVVEEKEKVMEKERVLQDQVPIVKLNESEARDLIDQVNDYTIDNFSRWIDPYAFEDPVGDDFYEDMWNDMARRNTELFRLVFHCQPDDQVSTWVEYKEHNKLNKAFMIAQEQEAKYRVKKNVMGEATLDLEDDDSGGPDYRPGWDRKNLLISFKHDGTGVLGPGLALRSQPHPDVINEEDELDETVTHRTDLTAAPHPVPVKTRRKRKRRLRRQLHSNRVFERDSAERILLEIQGHLVHFLSEWLLKELDADNWYQSLDRVPPIEIYD